LAGCAIGIVDTAGATQANSSDEDEALELVLQWPEPPLDPRIQFVQAYATEEHLGKEPTRKQRFWRFLAGTRPPQSHLYQPMDIVVSDDGKRIFVSDYGQLMVFVFDVESRTVTRIGENRPFSQPFGLALDADENLYVAEQRPPRIVVFNRDHEPIRMIRHPSLVRLGDLAIDRDRRLLYVADPATAASEEHSVKVFDLEGRLLRTVGSGKGACEGCLLFPTYVETDRSGNLYVTSTLNSRVDVFNPQGRYLRHFGERGDGFGMFDKPKGVALDSFGNVYVVDSGWSNVQIFNQKGQVLLFFGGRGSYPGLLKNPTGIAIDGNNRIYVADYLNYRVSIYRLMNTTAEDSFLEPVASAGESVDAKTAASSERSGGGNR
jgi:sugar lactone lactonase YvrE